MEIDITGKKPDIRYLDDMREVLYDRKWAKSAPNLELYYMYRGLKKKDGLRYDITLIPPQMLGEEFAKTKGHEHLNLGEVYIVLEGEAIFLIQKREGEEIKDVCVIKAKEGEAAIIPSGSGHVTINSSKETLKTANWLSEDCRNDYKLFEKKQGACYYFTKTGWIKNKNYTKVPKLRFEKPLKKMPRNLDFLKG